MYPLNPPLDVPPEPPSRRPCPYHYEKGVPYFLPKIEAYRTYVPYRAAIFGAHTFGRQKTLCTI